MIRVVFVTGASGYIGRKLCAFLKSKGVCVRAYLRSPESGPWDECFTGDINDASPKMLEGADTIFHLAGKAHMISPTVDEIRENFKVNYDATIRLAQLAEDLDINNFVFFSTLAAFSRNTSYGQSKYLAERAVLSTKIQNKVVLRPGMVYGPGCKGNLPRMIYAVSKGWFPPVPEIGRRSMVHVDDVVKAAWLAATRPEAAGRTYVVTDGVEYSVRKIHEWICKALGRKAPGWTLPLNVLKTLAWVGDMIGKLHGDRFLFDSGVLEKLIGDEWYDSTLIQKDLGFRPTRNLRDSMEEIVNHLRKEGVI
ncbi:MAG: NAD-dependent epimerase/dehydratase family protein [Gammaproteobacteria bacterium]|nr:MAG: NAD-dependent epimerase/dehydratase family protein [Gammaproteobacteria bacterium]